MEELYVLHSIKRCSMKFLSYYKETKSSRTPVRGLNSKLGTRLSRSFGALPGVHHEVICVQLEPQQNTGNAVDVATGPIGPLVATATSRRRFRRTIEARGDVTGAG